MAHADIGVLLAEVREEAGLTQKEMAKRLGVHQSQISRLESRDGNTEIRDFDRYLFALGSETALKLSETLNVSWRHLPRPSLKHPDLDTLVEIEKALQRLEDFRQSTAMPHALAGQADLLVRRLVEFGEYLLSLDHKIFYVGELGVGKTTAACRQAGLMTDLATAADLKGTMLDTGGGRTTLCEVYVQRGKGFAIDVEPLPDEEIYRLVEELCRSVQQKKEGVTPNQTSGDYRPPEEIERALRNMSGLIRATRKKGEPPPADPLARIGEMRSLDEFKAEVAARLTLWRRTRRTIEFEGSDDGSGRRRLKETFTAINNGRHDDFSLPGKITVTVPFPLVSGTPFNITLVDTRGIDRSAIRPDLANHLKDARGVTMLCSKWGSAPDPPLQDLLKHITETEVDSTLYSRAAVLVIARAGDGLSMRHESGESVNEPSQGYQIKCGQVEDALDGKYMSGIDVTVFDATYDDAEDLTNFLVSKLVRLRAVRCESAKATVRAVDEMLQNVQEAEALATLESVNNELRIFADRHNALKNARKPVHFRLLNAMRNRHPRTVWAATRRAGSFWNFDTYQYLGDGASADAKGRCARAMAGLREIIENRLADVAYISAHRFLEQLLGDVDAWESDFVKAARHHAVAIHKPPLSSDKELWDACEDLYGRGKGYREEVASRLESWFDDHAELQDELDRRVRRAWKRSVLKRLRAAAGGE